MKAIFPVNKLNDSSFLFFQAITDLNIPFINFNTNLFKDTTPRFLKDTITNWVWNASNLQGVSSGILGVFPALPFCFGKPLYKSVVCTEDGLCGWRGGRLISCFGRFYYPFHFMFDFFKVFTWSLPLWN